MTAPQIYLLIVVTIPLTFVVLDRLRVDVAALLMAVALGVAQYFGLGVLGPAASPRDALKAIAGLGQPVVLTLLSLFIITAGLDKSGLTHRTARYLLKIGGRSERRLIALFATTTALLSLVMNNLAAGSLVLPSAMEVSRRTGIKPSKLLIPVAYGSLLGGGATYFASANIIVSNLLMTVTPPQPPLSVLAFTPTGGLMAVVGLLFLILFGKRLLPEREPAPERMIARPTNGDLEAFYRLDECLWEARVAPDSPLVGHTLAESEIGERLGLAVAGIWRGRQAIFFPAPDSTIRAGDILLVVGQEERVNGLAALGVQIGREDNGGPLSEKGVSFLEVMPAPHSAALGHTLRELEFRARYHLTALALFRGERVYRTDVGDIPLRLGDTLLLVGPRRHLKYLRGSPDFIALEPDLGDRPVERGPAGLALGVLVAAVGASILGLPVYLAMPAGATVLLLAGVLEREEAYCAVHWPAIMLIAGMYSVSLALVNTGLARELGEYLLALVTPLGPLGLAGGAYLLTALLTQVMGGQVAALVTGPITISAAVGLGVNPQAVAVATALGCSDSFLTPLAHPVNILMMTPANYRFRDFFHIGWRLTVLSFGTLLVALRLFWGL